MPAAETSSVRGTPDDFLAIIRRQQLGKLKIYLGPCPGVGKTFQMLVEGNRLRRQGVDVVIGYVEPHDRPETTAQIGELEIVPPLVAKYHGITLKEMDLDAVLARKPTVALVDELAHTNAPHSRNRKRYEDVQDLLRAGINVIATVNIQHFESLYNIVEEATGVRVKERVPDEIIARAHSSTLGLCESAAGRGGCSGRTPPGGGWRRSCPTPTRAAPRNFPLSLYDHSIPSPLCVLTF